MPDHRIKQQFHREDCGKLAKLGGKRLFLFDIDGTLSVGDELFDGSAELLDYIEEAGGRSFYITNNSTKSGSDYVRKFAAWKIRTVEEQFVTAGYLTKLYLKENYERDKIFVLGTRSFIADLRAAGLLVTEEAEPGIRVVVAAFDSELNYGKLEKACEILFTMDVDYLATNPDLRCPAPFGFIPDCGAICGLIEAATGRTPVYLGKPSREVVDLCLQKTGFTREETLVVGDRLYTDIACGLNAGVDTCVVLTGEADKKELSESIYVPDYCFENVAELLRICRGNNR